jgi:hypothetical protein
MPVPARDWSNIMRFGRRSLISGGLGLLLGASVAAGGTGVLAQDAATPVGDDAAAAGRPVHIHSGTCDTLGDVVAPLNDLTLATGGTGADETVVTDTAQAIPAEYSFSTVPMTIDQILAAEHAINAHESAEDIGTYIACGDLAGPVDANGSLVVGLRELNESDYAGIAVLSPSAQTAGSTDVSVFIAGGLTGDDQAELDTEEAATPAG